MAALVRNYTIERGIQFSRVVKITTNGNAADLTGVTFLGAIRLSQLPTDIRAFPTGTGPIATSFDFDSETPGQLTFALTNEKSAVLERADYDYYIILAWPSGDKQRSLLGIITIIQTSSINGNG
jgi:hypothetical protein